MKARKISILLIMFCFIACQKPCENCPKIGDLRSIMKTNKLQDTVYVIQEYKILNAEEVMLWDMDPIEQWRRYSKDYKIREEAQLFLLSVLKSREQSRKKDSWTTKELSENGI